MKKIKVTDFSFAPYGRDNADGPNNGKRYRDEVLIPALKNYDQVELDICGVEGYGSSFLEEAFGGLVRHGNYSLTELKKRLCIKVEDTAYKPYEGMIWEYIKEENDRKR